MLGPSTSDAWSELCIVFESDKHSFPSPCGRIMSDTAMFKVPTKLMAALAAPLASAPAARSDRKSRQHERVFHDLSAVEEFLDWLERNGRGDRTLHIVAKTFVVRWRE